MSTNDEVKRTRSPAYPSIPLKKAIELAADLYRQERRNAVHVDVATKHWGYDAKSSRGLRAIAALKQFGLLEEQGKGEGRQVKLTSLALLLLMPEKEGSDGHRMDIQRAALLPPLHAALWKHYNGELPSDHGLKRYLILERNFNDDFVGKFIRQLRSTLAFANLAGSDIIHDVADDGDDQDESEPQNQSQKVLGMLPPNDQTSVVRDFPIPLLSGGLAVVKVPVPMSEADFEQITGTLNAWRGALVRPKQGGQEGGESGE